MAKHERKPAKDKTETQRVPIIIPVHGVTVPAPDSRLAKDIEICDKGWNNTQEGKNYGKGKHAK